MKILHLSIISGVCIVIVIGIYVMWFPSSSYNFTTYTKDNSLGIEAKVIYDYNPYLMCPISPCHTSKTFQLNFTSKQGSELLAYNICDGIFCINKDSFESHILNVHVQNSAIALGSVTAYETRSIILGDLPWKVGDMVNIKVKAMQVTLLNNGSLIRYPQNIMFVDLGQSKIIEVGNQTK